MLWHLSGKNKTSRANSISHCKWSSVGNVNRTSDSGYVSFFPMQKLGRKFKISVLELSLTLLSPISRGLYHPEGWCGWLPHLLELLPLSFTTTWNVLVVCAHEACWCFQRCLASVPAWAERWGGVSLQPRSHEAIPWVCCGRTVPGIGPLHEPNLSLPFPPHGSTPASSSLVFLIQPLRHNMRMKVSFLDDTELPIHLSVQSFLWFLQESLHLAYSFYVILKHKRLSKFLARQGDHLFTSTDAPAHREDWAGHPNLPSSSSWNQIAAQIILAISELSPVLWWFSAACLWRARWFFTISRENHRRVTEVSQQIGNLESLVYVLFQQRSLKSWLKIISPRQLVQNVNEQVPRAGGKKKKRQKSKCHVFLTVCIFSRSVPVESSYLMWQRPRVLQRSWRSGT